MPGSGFAPDPRLQLPPAPVFSAPTPPDPAPVVSQGSFADVNGPLAPGDPQLNSPGCRAGWFGSIEVGILVPHIKSHLTDAVVITSDFTDMVTLPIASLNWTASPRVELGYRFDEGADEVRLAYQSLESERTGIVPDFDPFGDGTLRSRVNVNLLDLDYAQERRVVVDDLALCSVLQGRIGVRLAGVFFDTRAVGAILEQRVSNNFFGAGPHAGLDVYQGLPLSDLSLFARVQGAIALGQTRQSFEEAFFFSNFVGGGATTERLTQALPMLDVQAGLTWAPWWSKRGVHFTAGYQFQSWWFVGEARSGSEASLTAQGLFLRGELGF
jgi:hypothetical protein